MGKTLRAERDAQLLADYNLGIRARELMEYYCLERREFYAIIRNQQKIQHEKGGI